MVKSSCLNFFKIVFNLDTINVVVFGMFSVLAQCVVILQIIHTIMVRLFVQAALLRPVNICLNKPLSHRRHPICGCHD